MFVITYRQNMLICHYHNVYEYWYTQQVLYFPDNTAYTTFEAFFNEKDFVKVSGKFMELAQ